MDLYIPALEGPRLERASLPSDPKRRHSAVNVFTKVNMTYIQWRATHPAFGSTPCIRSSRKSCRL